MPNPWLKPSSIKLWSFYEPTTLHHSINSFPYCHLTPGESWDQVRLPQPARSLHEDDLLQALDWESYRGELFVIVFSNLEDHKCTVLLNIIIQLTFHKWQALDTEWDTCFNASDHGKHSPVPRKVSDHKDRWYFYAYKPWGIEESCEGFSPTKLWYRDQDSQYTLVLLLNS